MKRAVSISIGSSKRDKTVEIELLGERVRIERIGTDGDMQRAAQMFAELDGKVDAFGVGGTDLSLRVADRRYPLYSVLSLVRDVHITPIADGGGLKNTLEAHLASFIDEFVDLKGSSRRALITSGADRWGMTSSFLQADYECVIGDLMFGLDLPLPVRSERTLKLMARLLLPIVGRVPFKWLYPTGEEQEQRKPKWESYFDWASVIAGDCHYITYRMPLSLQGKVVVTNTTTSEDVALFRNAGVHALVTSTPVYEGRSFGTNMMEAALIAVSGKNRPLEESELQAMIDEIGLKPQLQFLNA
ncbi:MAG: quinate 5-dehydrogenase [Anaerolineales bacterium]|nr:MAG: quinate 5-dehydrogenase [Anaerolineales bacterium]